MVQKIHLNIAGMTCVNCEYKIRKMVSSADGVSRAAERCAGSYPAQPGNPAQYSSESVLGVLL